MIRYHSFMPALPQYIREAVNEIRGTLADLPKGNNVVVGRGFEIVRQEMYSLAMDILGGDRADIEESTEDLARVRDEAKSLR